MNNNNITLFLVRGTNETPLLLKNCLFLSYEKEVYTPYTSLRATFLYDGSAVGSIRDVLLVIDDKSIHKGFADTVEVMSVKGIKTITVTSRGYTSLLGQTEVQSGIHTLPSLNALLSANSDIPNINHEDSSDTVNYINVKPHASVWEVITNLCLKLYGQYPYIANLNTVRYTVPVAPKQLYPETDGTLISCGSGLDYKNAVSDLYMLDTTDEYNYHLIDSEVTALNIIRRKYLALDKQWLNNPLSGLNYRMNFGMRGSKYNFVSYSGYCGEDVNDCVNYGDVSIARISRINITGGKNGLVTKLWCYIDRYNNRP